MNVNDPNYPNYGQPDFQHKDFGLPPMNQESWLKRNGLWFFPLILVVLGIPVFCCGSAIFTGVKLASLVNQPRNAAIEHMQQDQRVTDVLGSPLKSVGALQMKDMNIQNDSGNIELGFDVKGPNGNAHVQGKMIMTASQWRPEKLTVTCSDGTEIILPESAAIEDLLE